MLTTAIIFTATYAVVAAGRAPFLRLDRTGAAVVGAVLMVISGAIGFDEAAQAVDLRTLVLLFSMMIIVAHLRLSGGLGALANFIGTRHGHPAVLLAGLVCVAALFSALFVNDTVCLVFTPIVLHVAAARRQPALPYLLALATASNIGSAATLTGNPQNILIGSVSGVGFVRFTTVVGPVACAGLAIDAVVIWLLFRKELRRAAIPVDVRRTHVHRALLLKTAIVTVCVLAGFLGGYDTAMVAAGGAAALLVTRRIRPAKVYSAVDWDLLMLFVGLFVVVGAGERAGLAQWLFDVLRPIGISTVAGMTVTTAVLSNLVSNVPAVMLFAKLVPRLPDPERVWYTLGMASTLAGNLTIPGSIANMIVVQGARRSGVVVGFWDYARAGVPITVLSLLVGIWWLS